MLQLYPTPPAVYLRMLETVALQCVPQKISKEEILRKIDRRKQIYGSEEQRELRARIEAAVMMSKMRIEGSLLSDLSITTATKGALSCPKPQMKPYTGICPSLWILPPTAEERMLEVTHQARVSTRLRFVDLDIDWLTAHAISRSGSLSTSKTCQCPSFHALTGWASTAPHLRTA